MLNEPQSVNDVDMESINSIKVEYPYFVPARYMECADKHKNQQYLPSMMANMQLYMGNWLLFCDFLEQSLGDEKTKQPDYGKKQPESVSEIFATDNKDDFEVPVLLPNEPATYPAEEPVSSETPDGNIHYAVAPEEEPQEEIKEPEVKEQPEVKEEKEEDRTEEVKQEHIYPAEAFNFAEESITKENDDTLILPIYTEDYFLHQGIDVSNDIPEPEAVVEEDKSLMVVMSFSEWLLFFKTTTEKEKEEHDDKRALKTMWQKEKLAAALEEENEEIPENVFEMAVNSITREEDLASEPLADIYIKQGKYDIAIDMYRKLSLRNPQKSAYFARKIEAVLKEKQS